MKNENFHANLTLLGRGAETLGDGKAHKQLAHKQFLGHPGHRSSRPGARFLPAGYSDENVYVPWVPHTAHKLLTPGHRSGEPPPTRSGDPPPARAVTGKFYLCLCGCSFPEVRVVCTLLPHNLAYSLFSVASRYPGERLHDTLNSNILKRVSASLIET